MTRTSVPTQSEPIKQKLIQGCEQLGMEVDETAVDTLMSHLVLMQKWNRTHNLTAITQIQDMVAGHVLDSLAVIPFVLGARVLDIGTGGGFPGIPLAVGNPALQVTLLDSRGKRVEFLKYTVPRLGLENVRIENSRIEHYQPTQKFDTLTARAFSSLSDLVELARGCIDENVRILALKGKYPSQEIDILPDPIKAKLKVKQLKIPFLHAQRHLVIIDY